jgi:energy-coupling factor transport system ATP-binding protein
MITHDMDLIARYAERLIVMWNGQVILDGPTAEVFGQRQALERTFLRPPVAADVTACLQGLGVSSLTITPEGLLSGLRKGQD